MSRRSHRCKRNIFIESLPFGAQIHSDISSNENTGAKPAVEKEWEKLEKIPAWHLTKVRNKNEVIDEGTRAEKSILRR